MLSQRFAKSVIKSAKRMTYLEAQALIDDDIREARKHTKSEPKYPRELIQACKLMNELATTIRERRMKEGMIVLGLPAIELVFDESGRVVDAEPEDDAFTHKIIEMFMVEANEAAARVFAEVDVPMVRRHPPRPRRARDGCAAGPSPGSRDTTSPRSPRARSCRTCSRRCGASRPSTRCTWPCSRR